MGIGAIAETPAIETAHFGISVHLLQPAAVSPGGAKRAKVFLDDSNPYRPLLDQMQGFRSDPVTVQEVAGSVAVLAARKAAPEDIPFLAASLD